MNPFVLLFDFRGRINRAKFWLALLIYALFFFGVVGIAAAASSSPGTVFAASLIAHVPLLISGAAVGIKRLHDRAKSGWWLALFALPVVLPFLAEVLDDVLMPEPSMFFLALQYVSFGILIWAFIELGCLRGTIGANEHGHDPLLPAFATARPIR